MTGKVICPSCGRADLVEKVSTIYIAGLEAKRKSTSTEVRSLGSSQSLSSIPAADLTTLAHRLAPPSGEKQVTRPVHPDIVVATFSLMALVFLRGIYSSQPSMMMPTLVFLAVAYVAYFWQRKALTAKFENQHAARQVKDESVRRGIERWMRLYYCARDDGLFEPGDNHLTPADQIAGLLFKP